jgi:hypothetical protein
MAEQNDLTQQNTTDNSGNVYGLAIESVTTALVIFNILYFTQYDYIKNIDRSLPTDLCKPPYHEAPKSEFPSSADKVDDICAKDSNCGWNKLQKKNKNSSSQNKNKNKNSSQNNSSKDILKNLIGTELDKALLQKNEKLATQKNNKNDDSFYNVSQYGFPYKHMFTDHDSRSSSGPPFPTVCGSCTGMFDLKWLVAYYLSWYMESCAFSFAVMRLILKKTFQLFNLVHNDRKTDTDVKNGDNSTGSIQLSLVCNLKLALLYYVMIRLKTPIVSLIPILSVLLVSVGGFFTLSYGWILGLIFFFTGISSFWGLIVGTGQTVFFNVYLALFMFFRKSKFREFKENHSDIFYRNIGISLFITYLIIAQKIDDTSIDSTDFKPTHAFMIAAAIFLSTSIYQYNSYIKQLRSPNSANKSQDKLSNTMDIVYIFTAIIPIAVSIALQYNVF